jgi:integrase
MTLPSYERLAGTGARVTEARSLRWEDVDANQAGVLLRGTKSRSSRRHVSFNTDLAERMRRRHERSGGKGYVFASPYFTGESKDKETGQPLAAEPQERLCEQSNCAKALAALFVGAGFSWATPHCLRRTAATLAHLGGAPLIAIADQLGHPDPHDRPCVPRSGLLGRSPLGGSVAMTGNRFGDRATAGHEALTSMQIRASRVGATGIEPATARL